MKQLFRRLHYLLNRRRFDEELAEEMEAHRAMAARDGAAAFGNALRLREESRDAWGWTWIDRLGQDLRYEAAARRGLLRPTPLSQRVSIPVRARSGTRPASTS